jgi:hypothetical protein
MNRNFFFIPAVIFISLFFQSCSRPMYLPNTPVIPVCDTSKEVEGEFAFNARGFDFKMNGRVKGPLNISASLSSLGGKTCVEILPGYFKKLKDVNLGISAGYGFGTTRFYEDDGGEDYDFSGEGRYQKFFIQPMVAFNGKQSISGMTMKIGFMPYEITSINPFFNTPSMQLDHPYSSSFLEAWLFHKSNLKRGGFISFYLGFYSFKSSSMPIPSYSFNNVNDGAQIGIGLGIGGKWKNKKSKDAQ